jgi:hypothetical protein
MTDKKIELIDWLTNRKIWNKYFTDQEINTALQQLKYSVSDLTDEQFQESSNCHYTVNELVRTGNGTIKKYFRDTNYSMDVQVSGYYFRVPARYQGLKHGKILEQLLKNKFNWFDSFKEIVIEKNKPDINSYVKFKDIPKEYESFTIKQLKELTESVNIEVEKSLWSLYELQENAEIYLKTENGSLYVPLDALLNNDFSLIENRMTSYFKWYHKASNYSLNSRGRSLEQFNSDKEQDYINSLKPLESKEAIQLKKLLTKE